MEPRALRRLALLALVCAALAAPADDFSVEKAVAPAQVEYYDVSGDSAAEIRRQLNMRRPAADDDGSRRFDARTRWYYRWNWPGYGRSRCDLDDASLKLEVKVIFPRWRPGPRATADLRRRWNRYVRALAEHEAGHVRIARRHYQNVEGAIRRSTCNRADDAAHQALARIRQEDAAYDATTEHGRTQGARFP